VSGRSGLYVERVMRLGDEALNRIHAELEMALRRAGRGVYFNGTPPKLEFVCLQTIRSNIRGSFSLTEGLIVKTAGPYEKSKSHMIAM